VADDAVSSEWTRAGDAEERATIAAIYASYSRDSKRVSDMANIQIQQGIEQTNQFVGTVGRYMDNSDRMTAGMSDLLRGRRSSSIPRPEVTEGPRTNLQAC